MSDDVKQIERAKALKGWQRFIDTSRLDAAAQVDDLIARLSTIRHFHVFDLMRFRAQMLNGVACPQDFQGSTGTAITVA